MVRKQPRPDRAEVLVALPVERERVPLATHIRSTMILSSLDALRGRRLLAAYEAALPPAHREELLATVAGVWIPMPLGLIHYEACDKLGLTQMELLAIGGEVFRRSKASALHLAASLAKSAGATPWTLLSQARRLWERAFQGSAVEVTKLGPKEAQFHVHGWQLARVRYNRIALRGIVQGMIELFCSKAYVTEIATLTTRDSIAYRIAWA